MIRQTIIFLTCLCLNFPFSHSENMEIYFQGRLPAENGRYPTFFKALELLSQRNVKTIVETGTARCGDRNFDGDGGSTILFGHWAHNHNAVMYSVDISEKHIQEAKAVTIPYSNNLIFILQDSIEFLKNFNKQIDFLYLDSFDYSETDPIPSQLHHLKEIKAAYKNLTDDSIVMIDDCNIPGGGKGKLAISFLERRGWKRCTNRHQVILHKNPIR